MAMNAGRLDWAKPRLYPLAKNYRSHQGILSLAADIVDMLCKGEKFAGADHYQMTDALTILK